MNLSRTIFLFIISVGLLMVGCQEDIESESYESVVIAYSEPLREFSPLAYQASDRKYLAAIYETLVAYDATFNFETALAVSWGRIDNLTWEFHLREEVIFHDGSSLDAEDVIYSLNLARFDPESQLSPLLETIESVYKVDENTIHIQTKAPDPLLLAALTRVYIFPNGFTDFENPIGTAPYEMIWFKNEVLKLERFDGYWGERPAFQTVELWFIPDSEERVQGLLSGEIDVLANVPPIFVEVLKEEGMKISVFPSLEISVLVMNSSGILNDPTLREAVWLSLGTDYAELLGSGYLKATNQFAASGIFGTLLEVPQRLPDPETAEKLLENYSEPPSLAVDLPIGLESLGALIEMDLEKVGFEVSVRFLDPETYELTVQNGEADLYFLGWKYDLADLSDFFQTVIHSPEGSFGALNGFNYTNEEVDALIEELTTSLSLDKRQELLETITLEVLSDHIVLPLFESQLIYGIRPEIDWTLRLDGQILPSELAPNVL